MRVMIDASTAMELLSKLRKVDIVVPGRTKGRKSYHAERFAICRLLATLCHYDRLESPLSVERRERPDFAVQAANRGIGVEVTEAIDQQYAKYLAMAEREFPDACLEPALFSPGAPQRTVREFRELLKQKESVSDGWSGNQVERYWAQYVLEAIDRKIHTLGKSEFEKFELNWLSIYDNTPLMMLNLPEAIDLLCTELRDRWQRTPTFDAVFVDSGHTIVELRRTGSTLHTVNNLWA